MCVQDIQEMISYSQQMMIELVLFTNRRTVLFTKLYKIIKGQKMSEKRGTC